MASALVAFSQSFFAFGKGRGVGGEGGDRRGSVGAAVHSAGCTCSQISSHSGTWGPSMLGLMLPRRVASSFCVGEVLHSPSIDLRTDA